MPAPLPPGSLGFPFIGEVALYGLKPLRYVGERYAKYGPIFKTRILTRPAIFMLGPDANRFILSEGFDLFTWHEGYSAILQGLFGKALFLMDGQEHQEMRGLILPAMHGKHTGYFYSEMTHAVERQVNQWAAAPNGINISKEMEALTLEIAAQLLSGIETGEQSRYFSQQFRQFARGLLVMLPLNLPFLRYGQALQARQRISEYLSGIISQRRLRPTSDVLGLLAQSHTTDGKDLSDDELIAQTLIMLFAGHETTSSLITWFFYEVSRRPDLQAQLQEEIAGAYDGDVILLERLRQLRFLDAVSKEVERLHSPVPLAGRGVKEAFEFQGYLIPKDWIVFYSPTLTHRISSAWIRPEQFEPERFLPPREEHKAVSYSLVGFGGGPRGCIGMNFSLMELKVIAALVLKRYTVKIVPGQDITPSYLLAKTPRNGLTLTFTNRQM